MEEREKQINLLFTAELQFRLASAVRLATTSKIQPLDLPSIWIHGHHQANNEEIALRQDQADYAAFFIQKSATYLLAVAIKDAIRSVVSDPKSSPDPFVQAAYQIARLIRNAFAHAPFSPTWSIDEDCRNRTFSIQDVISLNTTDLQGIPFEWHHYGGPLALFQLSRFVRNTILQDKPKSSKLMPEPQKVIHQLGDLILVKVDELRPNTIPVEIEKLPDGGIPLGGGYILYPGNMDNSE